MHWEIFCQVIDNHGDLGVCLRLARDLATRGESVRLWVDDATALHWMAPDLAAPPSPSPLPLQICAWHDATQPAVLAAARQAPGEVLIEAFGCNPPAAFVEAWADGCEQRVLSRPHHGAGVWINLEYLSAEDFVERQHGLMSPVGAAAGAQASGVRKYFFYPGFTERTGGLLREPGLLAAQAQWDRTALRARWGTGEDEWLVSLFCYEPTALPALLRGLAAGPQPVRLLLTAGRAAAAAQAALRALNRHHRGWNHASRLRVVPLPWLSQSDFDQLLWACDFNFVRGEDSLVRALWAGRPWAWQLYEQRDAAHHAKLAAFLRWAEQAAGPAPADWVSLMQRWNGLGAAADTPLPLDAATVQPWQAFASALRGRLLAQPDLTRALCDFVREKR